MRTAQYKKFLCVPNQASSTTTSLLNIISSFFAQAEDVITNLYNVSMGVAVQDSTAGDPVTNVEQCVCPEEYTVSPELGIF